MYYATKENKEQDDYMSEDEFYREWNKVCDELKASGADLSKIRLTRSKFTVIV